VLAEAMAAGLPVLATRCDFGPSEMIEHGESGLLVQQDVNALTQGLDLLLGDKALRRQLGEKAKGIEQRFAAEAVLAEWDRLLERLVQSRAVGQATPKLGLAA
jgi:glycosyltransferase involved in cell wall biosynthesis